MIESKVVVHWHLDIYSQILRKCVVIVNLYLFKKLLYWYNTTFLGREHPLLMHMYSFKYIHVQFENLDLNLKIIRIVKIIITFG